MRSFVALHINEEVREALSRVRRDCRRIDAQIKWVSAEAIHLTLLFLGEVSPELAEAIGAGLDAAAARHAPFRMTVAGMGAFGPPRAPRVIWAGVREGADAVTRLQADVVAAAEAAGIAMDERAFTPHLTVARVKFAGAGAGALGARIEAERETVFGSVEVASVFLMRSVLRPEGPEYGVVRESRLGTAVWGCG